MPTTKISYKNRIPTVLIIIEQAKEPIGYTELHKRLIKETGVKLSKHTLNKCLKYLCIENKIKKTNEDGIGNPIKYSINIELSNKDITNKRIASNALISEHLVNDNSPSGAEANNWWIVGDEISDIIEKLISILYVYSHGTSEKKFEDYKNSIEINIIPHIMEIHKLVKSPLMMSEKTVETLSNIFCDTYNENKFNYFNQLDEFTKKEYNDNNLNFLNQLDEFTEKEYNDNNLNFLNQLDEFTKKEYNKNNLNYLNQLDEFTKEETEEFYFNTKKSWLTLFYKIRDSNLSIEENMKHKEVLSNKFHELENENVENIK